MAKRYRRRFVSEDDETLCATFHPMKVRDLIKQIEADGWYIVVTRGSHRQYKHLTKSGRVTIAGHPSDDVAPGTLDSMRKQAKLKRK